MSNARIVVVGSVNTDMVVKSERIPGPGETVTGGTFVMPAGGKGANQAVAAARLGVQVTLVARVGDDMFGRQAIENFKEEGILTDHVVLDPDNATGVALILVDQAGENCISVAPGANFAITTADVDAAADVIRKADVVLLQLEIPMAVVEHTAALAAEAGVPVILDPAPAAPLPAGLLPNVSVLTPNESEAERLTGIAVTDEASARQAAGKLLEAGARHVIITLGTKGALVQGPDLDALVPSFEVQAVDSTAAGDAFNGGLAAALASGDVLEDAVRQAAMVGALSVTKMGAQPSLPTAEELQTFAEKNQG
ncbi:MAG: ribokinase [Planctomycetaceae bacterium]|jgi:ribokinase|nr:ribokinase [Planctomycetaceae bacterium]